MKKHLLSWTLLLFACLNSFSQDLEKLKDFKKKLSPKAFLKKGIKVSGSISGNHVFYTASGIPDRAVPVNILYQGNLNISLFGEINMPVSFSLSNQNINFSNPFDQRYNFAQPFNRFVLKPTYKGFTLQVGTCALNFSPLTLAGHRYEGVGLEYKNAKKPFYFGFMWGNLQKAVRIDTSLKTANARPSYQQSGLGFQVGYKHDQDKIELILFTAKDNLNSLPYSLDSLNISPLQNAVFSIKGEKAFKKKLVVNAEVAFSGITTDTRAIEGIHPKTIWNSFLGILEPKATTDYYKAIKTGITYKGKTYNIGGEYSRIDPNYRTLGAYYFANDLETFSAKGATQLLQGKLNVSGNFGLQQDNVLNQKLKTLKRFVGSLNLAIAPSQKVNINLGYSNFTSFSNTLRTFDYLRQVTPYNVLDTLNFRQINQNFQGMMSVMLPTSSKEITKSISLNAVMQRGEDATGSQQNSNDLDNFNLDYGYGDKTKKLNLNASFYFSSSAFSGLKTHQLGPNVGITKSFLKDKLKTNASLTYTLSSGAGVQESIFNGRMGSSYVVAKKHNLNLSLIYLNRQAESSTRYIPNFYEFTTTLGYAYTFTVLDTQKK